ncbi:MAG: hypothetical protein PUJ11_09275 [Eubacteriaceae bacterium]|nr:hypothetical protein [Eubacteriaceae bacterium]
MSYNEPKKDPVPKYFVLALLPILCSIAGMPGAFLTDEVRETLPDIVRVMVFACRCIVYLGPVLGVLALKNLKESKGVKYKGLTVLCACLDVVGSIAFIVASILRVI